MQPARALRFSLTCCSCSFIRDLQKKMKLLYMNADASSASAFGRRLLCSHPMRWFLRDYPSLFHPCHDLLVLKDVAHWQGHGRRASVAVHLGVGRRLPSSSCSVLRSILYTPRSILRSILYTQETCFCESIALGDYSARGLSASEA